MTTIKTNRLLLRPIRETDAERFAELCNDIDIASNTARIPHPYTMKDATEFVAAISEAFQSGKEYAFAVCRNNEIIACTGTMHTGEHTYEIGYWVGAGYRGNGVATEAAAAVTQFSFQALGAKTVTAGFFADNPASGRVLEKVGYKRTGEITEMMSVGRGEKARTVRLSLANNDFIPSREVTITPGD